MVKKDKIIDKESKIINLTMDLTREKAIEMRDDFLIDCLVFLDIVG